MTSERDAQRRRLVPVVFAAAGSVAWLGGLLRLFGEAAARLLSTVRPEGIDAPSWISLGLTVALMAAVFTVLLPWYRRFRRQTREDMAAWLGTSAETLPSAGARLRRGWRVIVVVLGGATVLSVLLPGPVAAAVSMVAGLVIQIVAVVVATISMSGSTSTS